MFIDALIPSTFHPSTPPEIAGIVGAVFNAALQLGTGLGLAILSSITTTQNRKEIEAGRPAGYKGVSDAYWFMVAFIALETISLLVFYKVYTPPSRDVEKADPVPSTISESTIPVPEVMEKEKQ